MFMGEAPKRNILFLRRKGLTLSNRSRHCVKKKIHKIFTRNFHNFQIIDYRFNDLVCYTIDERPEMAPFRILSFDIECAGRKGVFPEPEKDPVIQIANYITVQGSNKPMVRNIFTLKSCSSIVGAQVFSFDNEAKMLEAWRDFIISVDPDIITGI